MLSLTKEKFDLITKTILLMFICLFLSTFSIVFQPNPKMDLTTFFGFMVARRLTIFLSFTLPVIYFESKIQKGKDWIKQLETWRFKDFVFGFFGGFLLFYLWILSFTVQYGEMPKFVGQFDFDKVYLIYGLIFPSVSIFQYIIFEVFNQFMVAFGEEFLFRGFIQKNLMKTLGNFQGLIISAIMFGLIHVFSPGYSLYQVFFEAFVGGLIFGYFYLKTKSLASPIIAHYTGNILQRIIFPWMIF